MNDPDGGLNTYGYALANPIMYTDPEGLDVCNDGEPCHPSERGREIAWDVATGEVGKCLSSSNPNQCAYAGIEVVCGVKIGKGLGQVAVGIARILPKSVPHKRVGRHMSPAELGKMRNSKRVQEGGGGQTRVSDPANPDIYRNPPKDDVYVEFDVPAERVLPHSKGTGRIPGPNSPDARVPGRNPQDYEMPKVKKIKVPKNE